MSVFCYVHRRVLWGNSVFRYEYWSPSRFYFLSWADLSLFHIRLACGLSETNGGSHLWVSPPGTPLSCSLHHSWFLASFLWLPLSLFIYFLFQIETCGVFLVCHSVAKVRAAQTSLSPWQGKTPELGTSVRPSPAFPSKWVPPPHTRQTQLLFRLQHFVSCSDFLQGGWLRACLIVC